MLMYRYTEVLLLLFPYYEHKRGIMHNDTNVVHLFLYICICHPLPSNSQQETTNSMSHVSVVAGLLLTLDHYQPQISLKLYIKYCTLDDKIFA